MQNTDEKMLTTVDNPYDPFTHYQEWDQYDREKSYNTNSLLARFAKTSNSFSDEENNREIEDAMKRIVNLFPDIYMIVYPGMIETLKENNLI